MCLISFQCLISFRCLIMFQKFCLVLFNRSFRLPIETGKDVIKNTNYMKSSPEYSRYVSIYSLGNNILQPPSSFLLLLSLYASIYCPVPPDDIIMGVGQGWGGGQQGSLLLVVIDGNIGEEIKFKVIQKFSHFGLKKMIVANLDLSFCRQKFILVLS